MRTKMNRKTVSMEGQGLLSYIALSHQGAMQMFFAFRHTFKKKIKIYHFYLNDVNWFHS